MRAESDLMKAHIVMRVAVAFGASTLFWSAASFAQQVDTNPPLPNVLLMIDNSGSMERMIDGTIPESNPANACNCVDNGPNNPPTCTFPDSSNALATSPNPNRWNTLQQVMTGSLAAQSGARTGFNCVAMPRAANRTFSQEYQIAGNAPYDLNYYLNFHRMVAEDTTLGTGSAAVACVVGPGALPGATSPNGVGPVATSLSAGGAATDYSAGTSLVNAHYGILNSASRGGACQFTQLPDGIISNTTSYMRYGLMTFDSDPDPGPGITTGPPIVVGPSPFTGMWSYFPGWNSGASCNLLPWGAFSANCQGDPVNCSTPQWMAVGARNPAAPPWEGRMVAFPTSSGPTQSQINSEVGQVILGSRPYGGTPLAGMFTAAQYFFQGDPTGPQSDPFVHSTTGSPCRKEFIVLVTDGAPNLDLRPSCYSGGSDGGVGGNCPFNTPDQIAANLYNNGMPNGSQQSITTYVIGFATSSFANDSGALVDCKALVTSGSFATSCHPATPGGPLPDPTFAPCCALENIAVAGSPPGGHAFFAQSSQDLQNALQTILGQIATAQTTRTTPAFSPVLSSTGNAEEFTASFQPNVGNPWTGDIVRTTYACPAITNPGPPTANLPLAANGDDFATDLNAAPTSRKFVTIQPSSNDGTQSIRPYAPTTAIDGLSFETATVSAPTVASAVLTGTSPSAATLGIPPGSLMAANAYPYTPTPTNGNAIEYLSQTQARQMILSFIFGQGEPSLPTDFGWVSRCLLCGAGNTGAPASSAFGDIYHAEPVVVGAPEALLDDASYSGFRTFVTTTAGGGDGGTGTSPRKPVVYAATNDGLLHAFFADVQAATENESWAMLMPLGMPQLVKSYPATDKLLLDGSPVVKDVVWNRTGINSTDCGSGTTVTRPPGTTGCPWHTTLVAGYGSTQQGYYTVDVTDPVTPVFEWQLTAMPLGNYQIFGAHSATPAIATVNIGGAEVGVAVLPGGSPAGGPTSTTVPCERIHHHNPTVPDSEPSNSSAPFYQERANVRCWGATHTYTDPVAGRSLSIVRLDTGEIVRVFARAADFNSADLLLNAGGSPGRVTDTQLDSPMTGTPVVYPNDVGAVATRIFVGDADGTVWRFDVSNPDPTKWFGDAFLDLYNSDADTQATTLSWNDGQPFDVPMVASLDNTGSLVLNIASGTTQTFDTTGIEFLYSVSEKVGGQGTMASPTKLRASVNWFWSPALPPPATPPTNTTTTPPSPLLEGERVSGPMTVFAGTLYFTTYYAGNPTFSCTPGRAKLWGFDFINPYVGAIGLGGKRLLCSTGMQDWLDPAQNASCGVSNPQSAVVPGAAILATPACSVAGSQTFAGGGNHTSLNSVTASAFGLQFNVPQANGQAPQTVTLPLTNPVGPTVIDSWASVVE